jgi:hypothetical protein
MDGIMRLTMTGPRKLDGEVTLAVTDKKLPFEYKRVK